MRRLLLVLALVAAAGCGNPGQHARMGAAAPIATPGQSINFDPTVAPGLTAGIGTTVSDSGGTYLWIKYSSANTGWRPVPVSAVVASDPSQAPGLKAPVGFMVTKSDGTASWVKSSSSDTDWQAFPGAPSTFPGAVTFNGVSTFNAEVSMPSVADFQPSGVTFTAPVTLPGATNAALVYNSASINFAATTTQTITIVPATPGFYAEVLLVNVIATSASGTSTTNVNLQAGNNASEDNFVVSTSSITAAVQNSVIAAGVPNKVAGLATPAGATAKQLLNLSTPVTLKITQAGAGTGGYAFVGYVQTLYSLHGI